MQIIVKKFQTSPIDGVDKQNLKGLWKLNMELDQPQLTREVPLSNNSSPNIILDGFRVKIAHWSSIVPGW